jgi:adenylate cyclase
MTGRARDGGVWRASERNDAAVPGAMAVVPPSQELSLDQLFAEPIVQQLMRRDKINEATTRGLLQRAMAARPTRKVRSIHSMPAAGDDANSSVPPDACDLIDWLSGDECHELDLLGLTSGFGLRLRTAGIPLDRMALHMRTLHPLVRGGTIAWAPDEPVRLFQIQHDANRSALIANPLYHVVTTQEWVTLRLDDRSTKWETPDVFQDLNLIELLIAPLLNASPLASAATFATRQATGFSTSQRALLRSVVPALRNASELKLLRAVETTLLATYVGTAAGHRILAGHVERGNVETLEAALMVCDLRGFTALANQLPDEKVLELLNVYFDQVVPAIEGAGGEILKFMGDGVLAYFRHEDGAVASCAAAFDAARAALARVAAASKGAGAPTCGPASRSTMARSVTAMSALVPDSISPSLVET